MTRSKYEQRRRAKEKKKWNETPDNRKNRRTHSSRHEHSEILDDGGRFLNCYYFYYHWVMFFFVGRSSTDCKIVVFFIVDARYHRNVKTSSSTSWSPPSSVIDTSILNWGAIVDACKRTKISMVSYSYWLQVACLNLSIFPTIQRHVVRCPLR